MRRYDGVPLKPIRLAEAIESSMKKPSKLVDILRS